VEARGEVVGADRERRREAAGEVVGGADQERGRAPAWALAAIPLALIALAILALALLDGPGLGERTGPPVEELAVERTVLRPGEIELVVRNTGPDPVTVAQVAVSDAYVDFEAEQTEFGRLEGGTLTLDYPWQEGSPYTISILTSTGATIEHTIDVAVETPDADAGFFGLMAVLGTYVGVIPVALGMLFLPFLRRIRPFWMSVLMAITVGLLAFLAIDGSLEGIEIAESGSGAFGGIELLVLGALASYLALVAFERYLDERRARAGAAGGWRLSVMVALGIGLHNLGEGLAIGSAYAIGSLALGAFLVIGFALHNTTEGLAIVAPLAARGQRPRLLRLAALGLLAGAPAILGALIGAAAYNPELSALLIGIGVGAIVQVVQQLWPTMRDRSGRALHPASVGGILAGGLALYATGLLIAV
jgi:ZIP family zinc transporter